MNYIIVSSLGLDSLVVAVNQKIEEGYVPCGSIVSTCFNNSQPTKFNQPMIKKELLK